MTIDDLERQVAALRGGTLLLVCRTPRGKEQVMSLRECVKTGSVYLHIAADELDKLLGAELGGDDLPVAKQKCNKTATKNFIFFGGEKR